MNVIKYAAAKIRKTYRDVGIEEQQKEGKGDGIRIQPPTYLLIMWKGMQDGCIWIAEWQKVRKQSRGRDDRINSSAPTYVYLHD